MTVEDSIGARIFSAIFFLLGVAGIVLLVVGASLSQEPSVPQNVSMGLAISGGSCVTLFLLICLLAEIL